MDKETRESRIGTIVDYFDHHDDDFALLELLGWTSNRRSVPNVQKRAVVAAVLPLLDDSELNDLVAHVADSLLYQVTDETEVAA